MVRSIKRRRKISVPSKPLFIRASHPLIDAVSILAGLRHESINRVVCGIIEEHIREGRAFGSVNMKGFQFGNHILAAGVKAVAGEDK